MNLKQEKTYCDSIRRKIVHLRRSVEKFLSQTGMAPTRFGRDAARDPRLVFDLRNGREPGDRVKRRVEHFMNIYGQEKKRSEEHTSELQSLMRISYAVFCLHKHIK